jgi:uncharacterized protein (TIGR02285 family)
VIRYLIIASLVFSTVALGAIEADKQSASGHYPFIWLHAPNNAASSGARGIDIDGSTASLLFGRVAAVAPKVLEANFERQFKLLQSGEVACTGKKIVTPRRAAITAVTSLPQLFSPGLRLYVYKGSAFADNIAARYQTDATLSLQQLAISYPRLIFAAVAGRSYTEALDQVFTNMRQQNRLWQRSAEDMASGVTQMLANGRVDAIVEYPNIVSSLFASSDQLPFASYNIKESAAFIDGYIMCSNTTEGKLLAQRFSSAIADASQQVSYLQAHLRWFPATEHAAMVQYYNKLYGTDFTMTQLQ